MVPQDLHIHSTFSASDSAVVPEMTVELIARVRHARVVGISDHFISLRDGSFPAYRDAVRNQGLYLGCEIDGAEEAREAVEYPFDYFIYHCRDRRSEYAGAELLVETGKPTIVSHPMVYGVSLSKLVPEALVEVNNRYVWRRDALSYYTPWVDVRAFVIGSDAHQPNWLGQSVARSVAAGLGIRETLVFAENSTQPEIFEGALSTP
jgi:histidinol phosphatase-like PHP family hydrolase